MAEAYKRPESVLVVVYTVDGHVLRLRRRAPSDFWQSVTGSLREGETPDRAARRELHEETGLEAGGRLVDTGVTRRFEILPQWRARYAPGVRENTEHEFHFCLPRAVAVRLDPAEHTEYGWLPQREAAGQASSWTDREAIETLPLGPGLGGHAKESVVLLHGIWCNRLIMVPLARRLQRCGYRVHLFGYPSVRRSPAQNAPRLQRFVEALRAPVVHFVGHSLGGLVLLELFHQFPDQPPGRVVLLGSPLAGSRSAARLMRLPLGRRLLGRSVEGALLGDGPKWRAPRDLGVIAGSVPLGAGLVLGAARQAGDGAVGVAETRIAGIRDHLVQPTSHTGLLLSPRVARQVCHFLRRGRFER